MNHQSDIIIYQTQDGLTKIDVSFDQDTVWLSLEQMAELFQRDRTVIGRHIKNIFSEGELQRDSVCAKFAHTADDGKTYQVDYKNRVLSSVEKDYLQSVKVLGEISGKAP